MNNSIKETSKVVEIIAAMKFAKIETEMIEDCNSLDELKIFFENYFIKSLVSLASEYDWDNLIRKIKQQMEKSASLVEIMVKAKKLFKRIFDVKINWLKQEAIQVFYVDNGTNTEEVIS